MSRKALKDVLLELKSQMRGKRASSYIKKVTNDEPVKDAPDTSKKKPSDSSDLDLRGDKEAKEPSKKAQVDGPVDFADEMKNFFKKQNTGKKREAPSASAFAQFASEKPKASPAVKKKGKE